jgi:hypothetical protein
MNAPGNDNSARWVAEKIQAAKEVAAAKVLGPHVIQIERKTLDAFVVATMALKRVAADDLRKVLDQAGHRISFAVNIAGNGYFTGDALEEAARRKVPIGAYGDLWRALSLENVGDYVNDTTAFIEHGLAQHTQVEGFVREADRLYLVHRRRGRDLRAIFLDEYDLTSEHLRVATKRYGRCDLVVNVDPNGGATSSAVDLARQSGFEIYKWGEFYSALHRP